MMGQDTGFGNIKVAVIARPASQAKAEAISDLRLLRRHAWYALLAMTEKARNVTAVLIFCSLLLVAPPPTQASDSSRLEEILGSIPVQEGGRVKPFRSFADEALLFITEKSSFGAQGPVQTIWSWIAKPDETLAQPALSVKYPKLRSYFEHDLQNGRIAPALVLNDLELLKEIRLDQAARTRKEKLTPLQKKRLELYERARFLEEIARGRIPGFIPHPDQPKTGWLPLEAVRTQEGIELAAGVYPARELASLAGSLEQLVTELGRGDLKEAAGPAELFKSRLAELLRSRDIVAPQEKIKMELLYLKTKPFSLAWVLYLVSAFLWALPHKGETPLFTKALFISAFSIHTIGFAMRVFISGRAPVTNMYETVVWVPWAAVLCSLIFWRVYRSELLMAIAAWPVAFALILAGSAPALLNPSIAPLVPVLRNNFWLTIHVLTITLGYGAFAFNWAVAHALLYHLAFKPTRKKRIGELTEYLFRTLQIGLILLGSGTVLGGVWASYSWGRFWGWDPKETWALIAFMTYLAALHGRIAGWLDEFGAAFCSALAFSTVIMAWYGVNFVLGAGLHSYGFGGGGVGYVSGAILADIIFLLFLMRQFKMKVRHG